MSSIPNASVITWAEQALGGNTTITIERSLHGSVSPWRLQVQQNGTSYPVIMRIPVPGRIAPSGILTNAEALSLAEMYNVPAPRLLACDRDGDDAGTTVSLETCLPGTSEFPDDLEPEELRCMGMTMAQVHTI